MPYYGYARQDRKARARQPITSRLVADLLQAAGADRVVSVDLHAPHIQGYFKIPSDRDTYYSYLDSKNVLIPYFEDINYVNHASIHEFNNEQSKCTVLLNNTEYHAYNIKRKDILYIDFEDLYKNLEKFINE